MNHDEGLDPDLLQLFDEASTVNMNDAAFLSATLVRLKKARRARFYLRVVFTAIVMASAAVLAPYVAQATMTSMDWLVEHLPQTGMALASPIGCACAALIAWRSARRRFN
jgi:TRAP-type C4-dicarboxylate transport system permease small subunit